LDSCVSRLCLLHCLLPPFCLPYRFLPFCGSPFLHVSPLVCRLVLLTSFCLPFCYRLACGFLPAVQILRCLAACTCVAPAAHARLSAAPFSGSAHCMPYLCCRSTKHLPFLHCVGWLGAVLVMNTAVLPASLLLTVTVLPALLPLLPLSLLQICRLIVLLPPAGSCRFRSAAAFAVAALCGCLHGSCLPRVHSCCRRTACACALPSRLRFGCRAFSLPNIAPLPCASCLPVLHHCLCWNLPRAVRRRAPCGCVMPCRLSS